MQVLCQTADRECSFPNFTNRYIGRYKTDTVHLRAVDTQQGNVSVLGGIARVLRVIGDPSLACVELSRLRWRTSGA